MWTSFATPRLFGAVLLLLCVGMASPTRAQVLHMSSVTTLDAQVRHAGGGMRSAGSGQYTRDK